MNNLTKRILFGLIYVFLIAFATLYSPLLFFILFFIFMNFCIYEFQKMIQLKSFIPYLIGGLTTISFIFPNENLLITNSIFIKLIPLIILILFVPFIINLFSKNNTSISYLGKLFLTLIYIVLPFALMMEIPFLTQENQYDNKIMLGVFILIWTNDTFAYLIGKNFGKNKLARKISPNKTIEGLFGGIVFTLIITYFLSKHATSISMNNWFVIALIVSVFGVLGDLIESKFKRQANIKDSSNFIPGHGGFLDRLDSVIFATPFIFIYLKTFI